MEQTDCECPCECPLEFEVSLASDSMYEEQDDDKPGCALYSEELVLPTTRADTVPSCFQVDCSLRKSERYGSHFFPVVRPCSNNYYNHISSYSICLGVLGCEWCQLDASGMPLKEKFCNYQRECFGGVLGVRTPYADEMIGMLSLSIAQT